MNVSSYSFEQNAHALKHSSFLLLQDEDSYILPVLLRFDGKPHVNEEVYIGHTS